MKAHALAKYLMKCPDLVVKIPDETEGDIEALAVWEDTESNYLYLSSVTDGWGWHSRYIRRFP
jgi:hypothetical protein